MRLLNHLAHTIAPDLLLDAKLCLDCGANHGAFARWLSENTSSTIHAFEPDPGLYAKLPALDRVVYHNLAIDGESGFADLAIGVSNCSSLVYRESDSQSTVQVGKISLDDFCESHQIGLIDFIKLDIEGAEIPLLERTSATRLQSVKQISVEFHDFINHQDIPRIRGVFKRLTCLGFYAIRFSFFTWGDCLFINQKFFRLSYLHKIDMQISGKFAPGIRRFVQRKACQISPIFNKNSTP